MARTAPPRCGRRWERCQKNPDVQIVVSDGLSSKAIEANVANALPVRPFMRIRAS